MIRCLSKLGLWLELSDEFGSKLHHRDVVGVALRRMNEELHSSERTGVMADVREELEHRPNGNNGASG